MYPNISKMYLNVTTICKDIRTYTKYQVAAGSPRPARLRCAGSGPGRCLAIFKRRMDLLFEKYVTLLIWKSINAVTVMFAVMTIIAKIINAVPVMPVKMYQTIAKHTMVVVVLHI